VIPEMNEREWIEYRLASCRKLLETIGDADAFTSETMRNEIASLEKELAESGKALTESPARA